MIKRVFVKSSMCGGETEAQFFNDKEWKIVLKCESSGESMGDFVESRESLGESNADSNESRIDSSDSGESSAEFSADSQITITFFALENDIDDLARGYLATFLEFNFTNLRRENNSIFVDSHLSKDEILLRLSQKDIIQSCEQISLSDKKMTHDSLIMPFNGSRAKITREILEANRGFFTPTRHCESLRSKAKQSTNQINFPHKARILLGESHESNAESFDTNPKNAIYKAIGKAFDYRANGKQITTKSSLQGSQKNADFSTSSLRELQRDRSNPSLLDAIIFLNFRTDIECLKILLLQKCTFIVCDGIPSFSVVRFAQKFGITLMAFIPSKNGDLSQNSDSQKDSHDFLILTHALRFES